MKSPLRWTCKRSSRPSRNSGRRARAKGGRAAAKSMSRLREEEVLQKWAGCGISPMMVRDYRLLMGGPDGTPFKILLLENRAGVQCSTFSESKRKSRFRLGAHD